MFGKRLASLLVVFALLLSACNGQGNANQSGSGSQGQDLQSMCNRIPVGQTGKMRSGKLGNTINQNPHMPAYGDKNPDPNFIVLGSVPAGTVITVNDKHCTETEVWDSVTYQGISGWILEAIFVNGEGGSGWITQIDPICPIQTITVDRTLSQGVVNGYLNWSSSICDGVTISITNLRGYWVNLKTGATVGSPSVNPVAEKSNFYASHAVLGPNATVSYQVKFNRPGESVSFSLDLTDVSGNEAQTMNFFQALVDGLSLTNVPIPVDALWSFGMQHEPDIVNTISSLPNLNDARQAFFRGDFATFKNKMLDAYRAQELKRLFSTIHDLGFDIRSEALSMIAPSEGKVLNAAQVMVRNFGNIYSALFKAPAGSIAFDAR